MKYILLSENARGALELASAAKSQGADEIVAVLADPAEGEAETVAKSGVDKVIVANPVAGALKERAASVVLDEAAGQNAVAVLVAPSRRMVSAAGRLAAALGTAPIVDANALDGCVAKRMMFGGKALVGEKPSGNAVVVMAGGAYDPAATDGEAVAIETVTVEACPGVRAREVRPKQHDSVDLAAAKRIVSIGRGVNCADGFDECKALAGALRAEMGCTRPVTETENPLMPRETYIGASGVSCKPDLFVSVAASGQTQHTMGMYESGVVVAIDKNKDALIFDHADYGLVGDYREIVPALTAALEA